MLGYNTLGSGNAQFDDSNIGMDTSPKGKALAMLLQMIQTNPQALKALGPAAVPYLQQLATNVTDPATASAAQGIAKGLSQ
jgi:hypothetical protein